MAPGTHRFETRHATITASTRTGFTVFRAALALGAGTFAVTSSGVAQSTAKPAAADTTTKPTTADSNAKRTATILSFRTSNGFTLVEADINGKRGVLMLDTGSPTLVLNTLHVPPTNVTSTGQMAGGGVNGSIAQQGSVKEVRLGDFLLNDVVAVFVDLSSLEQQVGGQVLGIIGLAQLEPFEAILDHGTKHITLVRLDSLGRPVAQTEGFAPADTVPLVASQDGNYYVHAKVGTVEMNLIIDTGAPDANYFNRAFRGQLAGHLTTSPDSQSITIDHLQLGRHTYDALQYKVYDPPTGDADQLAGILGAPFLEAQQKVGFNLRAKQLLLSR